MNDNVIVQAEPKNVMLVHGEAEKMEFLKQKIVKEFGKCLVLYAWWFVEL